MATPNGVMIGNLNNRWILVSGMTDRPFLLIWSVTLNIYNINGLCSVEQDIDWRFGSSAQIGRRRGYLHL